jgi:hypothetical protein
MAPLRSDERPAEAEVKPRRRVAPRHWRRPGQLRTPAGRNPAGQIPAERFLPMQQEDVQPAWCPGAPYPAGSRGTGRSGEPRSPRRLKPSNCAAARGR